MNDLRALFALCFGLLGHGAEHALGQIDLLNLDVHHLYAPWSSVLVEDGLNPEIQLLAMRK